MTRARDIGLFSLLLLASCRRPTPPPEALVDATTPSAPAPAPASASAPAPAVACSITSCSDTCPCAGHNTCSSAGRCERDPQWKIVELVVGGDSFACAHYENGRVWCAGDNDTGQCGRGTDAASNAELGTQKIVAPAPIEAFRQPIQVVAGDMHACAIWPGGVSCWGFGGQGELGGGKLASEPTPQLVSGLDDATSLAAGKSHTCAIKKSGAVVCWGRNGKGQLGDGTTERRVMPVTVTGVTNAKQLSLGVEHSCALKTDGSVVCWGGHESSGAPHAIAALPHVDEIAALARATCARTGGVVRCWGGDFGQQPTGLKSFTDAAHIAGTNDTVCGLRINGTVFCSNARSGGVGITNEEDKKPLQARLIATSHGYDCSVRKDERLDCGGALSPALTAAIEKL